MHYLCFNSSNIVVLTEVQLVYNKVLISGTLYRNTVVSFNESHFKYFVKLGLV